MPASTSKVAFIAGATGLVGRVCLEALLARSDLERVIALGRRAPSRSHPRLDATIVDFDRPETLRAGYATEAYCALGTTIAAAGSQEAFRAVDYRAVLAFADLALESGADQFVLVSSVGADAASGNFYLRVKGEAEAAVSKRPFRAVHILRPGLLLGNREESRPAERLLRTLAPALNPLLVGRWRHYRAIPAETVGRAMAAVVRDGFSGRRVIEYDEIARFGSALSPAPLPGAILRPR